MATEVKGMGEAMKQAEAGMALFAKEEEWVIDGESANAFKAEHEAAMKVKEGESAALTGKDNKKARQAIDKEVAAMKTDPKYIDAVKIAKGLPPPNKNFATLKAAEAPAAPAAQAVEAPVEEKKEKKDDAKKETKKKVESAGISKAERDELEKLKQDIIKRKGELKDQGLSGGQCNKDEQVVAWVARMQELKIKEDPTLADAGKDKKAEKKGKVLSGEAQKQKEALEQEIEAYRLELVNKFGYSKKDIANDPDMQEKVANLKKLK